MPRTLYGRYWDLHLTNKDRLYDFAKHVKTLADSQGVERSGGLGNQLAQQGIFVRRGRFFRRNDTLEFLAVRDLPPARGYVASGATILSVKSAQVTDEVRALVRWINDSNFRSKIRINVHGSPGGELSMDPREENAPPDPDNRMPAEAVVVWLRANGLTPGGGLKTINVSACYSALDAALFPNSRSGPRDTTSAIRRIATALAASGLAAPIRGVEVTGGNEAATGNGFARDFFAPTGGGFGKIEPVPDGKMQKGAFQYDAFFNRVEIPVTWELRFDLRNIDNSFLIAPQGATATRGPVNRDGGPNSGWIVRDQTGAEVKIEKLSNWLVFPESVLDPSQPQNVRIAVLPAPGWLPELSPIFGRALRTFRFIRAPGKSQPLPDGALLRSAQSVAKERVFS